MKKLSVILAVLLCIGLSIPAYAQGESDVNKPTSAPVEISEQAVEVDDQGGVPRLADGVVGRGTVEAPDKYWAQNGYPNNISFAYEAGGEMLDDGISISYWEIGVVNADEAAKQEITDLLSQNCRITFRDCTVSYAQREAVYNEIYTSRNDIVRDVLMLRNSEVIMVEIADGYEKEYAQKYIEQYGAFVVVTNDVAAADDAMAVGGLDRGNANNPFGMWWLICFIFIIGAASIVFINRTRLIPAMQTNTGDIVTRNTPISRKQTVAAIKSSALTPSEDVFSSITDRIENLR